MVNCRHRPIRAIQHDAIRQSGICLMGDGQLNVLETKNFIPILLTI